MENFNRIFSMSDASMIETAYTLHSLFNDHMADFTALDAQLDAAFATTWIGKIDAASTAVRDSQTFTAQDLGNIGNLLIAKSMPGMGADADVTAVISL